MILEAQQWHSAIFDIFKENAFSFSPDPKLLRLRERHFPCPDCDRWFTTPQGVSTHRRKVHGHFCPEHHLLDSATCPACLTYLWSTQRLQQHLSYMPRDGTPNVCFAYLQSIGYAVSYSVEHLPRNQRGQSRLDALPVAGPYGNGPSATERRLAALRADRLALEAQYLDFVQPDDPLGAGSRLGDLLSAATRTWFNDRRAAHYSFGDIERPSDRWIDILCRLPSDFESWTARVFILWGQHLLPDLCDTFHDGDAAAYLDVEFAELAFDFDEYHMANRLQRLDRQIAMAQLPLPPPLPHRAVRPPQQNVRPRSLPQFVVERQFDEQARWQDDLRRVEWLDMPQGAAVPLVPGLAPRPSFIIVHLFAGRRRADDFHSWLDQWALRHNIQLTILSLDTAISPVLGNLDCKSETWSRLQELYLGGRIAATLSGHPCETFSSARWAPPPEDFDARRWPRPLRTAMQLFGIDHRSFREMRQTRAGSAFYLQTLWTLACHIVFGGHFIEEHPGIPWQPHHPSVWRSAIMQVLRKHPDIRFHEIGQWRFGATTVKPTGLLSLRLPRFLHDLYAHADEQAVRPAAHAIGVDESGHFRTSGHKEYPCRLSAGLASAIGSQLLRTTRSGSTRISSSLPLPLEQWVRDVAHDCKGIRAHAQWLPDFQG